MNYVNVHINTSLFRETSPEMALECTEELTPSLRASRSPTPIRVTVSSTGNPPPHPPLSSSPSTSSSSGPSATPWASRLTPGDDGPYQG